MKLVIKKTALTFVLVVVTIALLEAGVRVYERLAGQGGLFVPDSKCGALLKPGFKSGAISINSFGFRDRPRMRKKPQGTYRILVLGDSFVFGAVDVKDNFPSLLESSLNQNSSPWSKNPWKFEVIPAGVPGFGTSQELALLEKTGLNLSPDMVLLCFYAGNDIYDSGRELGVFNGHLVSANSQKSRFLSAARKMHLVRLAEYLYRYRLSLEKNHGLKDGFSIETFLDIQKTILESFKKDQPRYLKKAWQKTARSFRRMAGLLEAKGIRFLTCIIPAEIQVDHSLLIRFFKRFPGTKRDGIDLTLVQKRLAVLFKELQVPFVDFSDEFRQRIERGEVLYLKRNTHLNEHGCGVVAKRLYGFLGPFIEKSKDLQSEHTR
ncbi:MAG: hypothetical protein GXP49_12850 [Deltaproteobacteria bacterium]|nr:hypothetical protein [Deltaproteobacteria bacterium]